MSPAKKKAPKAKPVPAKAKPVPAKAATARKARAKPAVPRPDPYEDFMASAYAMEIEASDRYTEFAEQMEAHNNAEVATFFRKLARIEGLHASQILDEMGWKTPRRAAFAHRWDSPEGPETTAMDEVHYLMQPMHVLELALKAEQAAEKHYARIARDPRTPASIRKVALEMRDDETEHVRLIREWMAKVPKPDANWDHDPDPPGSGD